MNKTKMMAASAALAWCVSNSAARAINECETKISRTNVARCAVTASLVLRQDRQGIEVEEARRLAVSLLLPSNPALALSGGRRTAMGSETAGAQATNWYATLSQEVEIAGQRSARRDAASAAKNAQQHKAAVTAREVAAGAWRAYFEVLAGFDERVLGGGISLPVPLPSPLGRTYAGQIAENEALVRQASASLESARRDARLELVSASRAYEAALAQRTLYTEERIAKAERSLDSIARELEAGRLSISSVVLVQQAMIEFLRASIDAKLTVCLASVELVRTAALPLAGGAL